MPKEFSEWEVDYSGLKGPSIEKISEAYAILKQVQAWAEAQPRRAHIKDGWRVTAVAIRPSDRAADRGIAPEYRWEVYVGYHTDANGKVYPDHIIGDFIGSLEGPDVPSRENLISMLTGWLEDCPE